MYIHVIVIAIDMVVIVGRRLGDWQGGDGHGDAEGNADFNQLHINCLSYCYCPSSSSSSICLLFNC